MTHMVDDTKETVSRFLDKVAVAHANGLDWVETSEAIFGHYFREKSPGDYFWFHGVKVFRNGTRELIEHRENEQMGQRLHGPNEGKVIGR